MKIIFENRESNM